MVVVLNWNGWDCDTRECLESLRRVTYQNCRILLVDNGSSDSSVEQVRAFTCPDTERPIIGPWTTATTV